METENSVFRIPEVELEKKAQDFETNEKISDIFVELDAINKEIEACRLRNS